MVESPISIFEVWSVLIIRNADKTICYSFYYSIPKGGKLSISPDENPMKLFEKKYKIYDKSKYRAVISRRDSHLASMSATRASWVRQRTRLWVG